MIGDILKRERSDHRLRAPAFDANEVSPSERVPPAASLLEQQLVARARVAYQVSVRRAELLGPALFADPAWHMLLDLLISEGERRRLSVSALCLGSRRASATAIRYIGLLADEGLVERNPDPKDARRCFVDLSARGREVLTQLLGDHVG